MSRYRSRVCLQDGLRLNLNNLVRKGFVYPGAISAGKGIRWTNSYTEEDIATGLISADLSGEWKGWLRIRLGDIDQWLPLRRQQRRFGGSSRPRAPAKS